jgi:hypothetical protein
VLKKGRCGASALWGDEPELAGENAEKYVSKRWKDTTRECSIALTGRITDEDVLFSITAYVSDKSGLKDLVDDLLDVGLTGKSKIYSITVSLYDDKVSDEERYRESLNIVQEACKRREQTLTKMFRENPEVKALLEGGKPLIVIPVTTLFCELESERVNKVIVKAGNYNLEDILSILHLLINRLIERNVAKNILGYGLREGIEELEIDDLYVKEGKVYIWLGHPAVKH